MLSLPELFALLVDDFIFRHPILSSVMLMQPALSGQSSHLSSLLHSRVGDTSRLHPSFYLQTQCLYHFNVWLLKPIRELSVSEREDNNEMADILS